MGSILDEYVLTKEKFEAVIANGAEMWVLPKIFHTDMNEIDKWCLKEYGHSVKLVYEWVKSATIDAFLGVCRDLGERGNASALGIINAAIQKSNQDQTVRIVFDSNVPKEDEMDKVDNDEIG